MPSQRKCGSNFGGIVLHRWKGLFVAGRATKVSTSIHVSAPAKGSLVNSARIPIGHVSVLELPAGMIDEAKNSVAGAAAREMEEECGIKIRASDLIDLTEMACKKAVDTGNLLFRGLAPSPGGCDEFLRILYLEKQVSPQEINDMRGRLAGLREQGELITLHVVPFEDVWRLSGDSNAMW